ncbi:MAG: hypothetical protein KAI83_17250, partial [Thiomargarita sp.]|nr:hypothetical protein [Thiomargarita sp.]
LSIHATSGPANPCFQDFQLDLNWIRGFFFKKTLASKELISVVWRVLLEYPLCGQYDRNVLNLYG